MMAFELSSIKIHYLPKIKGKPLADFVQRLVDDKVVCEARGHSAALILATLDELRAIAAEMFQGQPQKYKTIAWYINKVLALRAKNNLVHLYIRW
jgi:hypothetical protein